MNTQQTTASSTEIRDRIFAAANDLYEQAGRERFPTVDAVRRASRADMNTVSAAMKEWRQAQTKQAAPVAIEVPDVVRQASAQAVAALWAQAQELANESLRTAQAAWDAERQKLDELRDEVATAFETQAAELDEVRQQLEGSQAEVQRLTTVAEQLQQELKVTASGKADAEHRAQLAEQRAADVERHAADLKAELERAHVDATAAKQEADAEAARLRDELQAARAALVDHKKTADAELERLRTEVADHKEQRRVASAEALRQAERFTKLQEERDNAAKEATDARVLAAQASGKLEALQTQNAALLDALKPAHGDAGKGGKTK